MACDNGAFSSVVPITESAVLTMAEVLNLREASRKNREMRIRTAAEKLLKSRNINDITTKEVAALAGIGEATLFRYIGSKMELLFITYADKMDDLLSEIERSDARHTSTPVDSRLNGAHYRDRIFEAYKKRCEFYLENPENAAIYLRAGFDSTNVSRGRNIAQGDRSIRLAAAIVAEGQAQGALLGSVDSYLVAQNCHGIYMHEIDRTPTRGFAPDTIWDRIRDRLSVQLDPLIT